MANQGKPTIFIQVIQSITYLIAIVLCAFSATHYYISQENQRVWKWTNQTKIQRAIQLAIENNGFPEMPRINYKVSVDQPNIFPPAFVVIVSVENKHYKIVTDQRAEILQSVEEVTP